MVGIDIAVNPPPPDPQQRRFFKDLADWVVHFYRKRMPSGTALLWTEFRRCRNFPIR